jgi:HSP20 family protein
MANLPSRRGGRHTHLVNPSREFEDIYDRIGQLMNMAFGPVGPIAVVDLPWVPAADLAETNDAYVVRVELPGVRKDQVDLQLQDRSWSSAVRSRTSKKRARPAATAVRAAPADSNTGL